MGLIWDVWLHCDIVCRSFALLFFYLFLIVVWDASWDCSGCGTCLNIEVLVFDFQNLFLTKEGNLSWTIDFVCCICMCVRFVCVKLEMKEKHEWYIIKGWVGVLGLRAALVKIRKYSYSHFFYYNENRRI